MLELIIQVAVVIIIASVTRGIAAIVCNRDKAGGRAANGVINQPNVTPVTLGLAVVFTLIMASCGIVGTFETAKDIIFAIVVTGVMDFILVMLSLSAINWYVWPKDDELIFRNSLNKVRKYSYHDLTECIRRKDGGIDVYTEKGKIFSVAGNLTYQTLEDQLTAHGIRVKEK